VRIARAAAVFAALFAFAFAASASAAVKWDIKARWGPTTMVKGATGQVELTVQNVGNSTSSGAITVTDKLPAGVSASSFSETAAPWSCFGTVTVTCQAVTTVDPLSAADPHQGGTGFLDPRIVFDVNVSANAAGGVNTASVRSPGAVQADGVPCGSGSPVVQCATDVDQVQTSDTASDRFGFVAGSFVGDLFSAGFPGVGVERQAGTHPFALRTDFDFNLTTAVNDGSRPSAGKAGDTYTEPVERVRTVDVTLARGISGNPEAVPKCSAADFAQVGGGDPAYTTHCPSDTQVGVMTLELREPPGNGGYGFFSVLEAKKVPIYNLVPPRGVPADLGFRIVNVNNHIYPSLDPSRGYALTAHAPYISTLASVGGVRAEIWGVPADPSHDLLRAKPNPEPGESTYGASSDAPIRPFLTTPSDCGSDNGAFVLRADSWAHPEVFTPDVEGGERVNVAGCEDPRFRFEPQVRLQPTSRSAGGPTGLDVHLEVPQRDNTVDDAAKLYAQDGNVHGIDTPPIKKAVITFPEGMTLSTSAAQGLSGCTPDEIGIGTDAPVRCPESSRYGSLTLHTPILPKDEPMRGDIYIAQQDHNPFNSFLAMYFVIHDEARGLLIKLPGRIDLDPENGQITTTFDDLPQFPVSDFQLSIKGGVRAGLVNPATCGEKQITAEFFPWHEPENPVVRKSTYAITQKPDGSPCVKVLGERQFRPEFSAGTVNPNAGSYSPFIFRLQRSDDDQEFSQLSTTLPPGLLANISKLTECPETAIRQAEDPHRTGSAEALFPSCPASSQLGTTDVGSGVGQVITYIPGRAYLAGPYRGEPLSMVVITPILAGPYDLGVIAVRSAIHVDGARGQATIATDPFPQIYRGIPVRIRDIRVKADTPETILNPTNCTPMSVTAHVTGTGGNLASTADDTAVDLSDRFQAANCASLPFKPKLSFKLKGGTKRGDFPAFSALLEGRPGDANIARSTVVLPGSLFIEQGHIRTVCTRIQYAADQCPAGSIYGIARARSPLFDEVLEGPVYLRSNGGERLLPDLVVKLKGKIEVTLAGFVDSLKGRVRNTFDVVPDAPVTFFSLKMKGGKDSLIVNHRDLCAFPSRASVLLTGQNGKTHNTRPKVAVSCGQGRKNKSGRGASR
jgi:uncharacterized repeat protein (TIGR01451 family)